MAAMLPSAWPKRLIDMNVEPLNDADLAWADVVMLGGLTIQWEGAQQVIARCKAAGKKIVAGGPLFTAAYALFQDVDHFVLNEAELTVPSLVADLEKGQPRRMYRSREFADMRQTPTPLWELAKLDRYAIVGIQYSRGCPFDCDFCNVTATLGRRPRVKDASQIIRELEALYRAGWRERVFFVDDNLIGNKPAARNNLLPALIPWQREHGQLPLCTQVSPRAYCSRIRTLLREFPSPRVRRPLKRDDLKAMWRAMVHFGIVDRERWHYWASLAWTLWHKPRLLAMAVRLAAVGHHHRCMSDELATTLAADAPASDHMPAQQADPAFP